jgi:hypothetical protein
MKNFFLKDNFFFGIFLSITLTGLTYLTLHFLTKSGGYHNLPLLQTSTVQLLAIVVNIIPFRYYMIKLKFDKTGRGIFLISFILSFIYIFYYFAKP